VPTPGRRGSAGALGAYLVLIAVSVLFLAPIFWIFATSFKSSAEIMATPASALSCDVGALFGGAVRGLSQFLDNSLIAAGGATALGLLLAVPTAFGFAKFPYPGSAGPLSFIVVTRVFPTIARALGLIDTPFGLIIAYLPIVLPLMIWMLHGFFRDFPNELLEAAELDGLNVPQTLVRIVLPLSLPGLGVATLLGFLVAWNEFIIALTLTRTPAGQTMPIGISTRITQFQVLWGPMMAAAAIYLLPVFVVTVVTQRGLVRGLMMGATKG
jgi:multiple sugar transport system permease protein